MKRFTLKCNNCDAEDKVYLARDYEDTWLECDECGNRADDESEEFEGVPKQEPVKRPYSPPYKPRIRYHNGEWTVMIVASPIGHGFQSPYLPAVVDFVYSKVSSK